MPSQSSIQINNPTVRVGITYRSREDFHNTLKSVWAENWSSVGEQKGHFAWKTYDEHE